MAHLRISSSPTGEPGDVASFRFWSHHDRSPADDRFSSVFYFLLSTEYLLFVCGPRVRDGLASTRSGRRAKFKASGQSLIVMTMPPGLAMAVQTVADALGHLRLEMCFFLFFSRLILTKLHLLACCPLLVLHAPQAEHRG